MPHCYSHVGGSTAKPLFAWVVVSKALSIEGSASTVQPCILMIQDGRPMPFTFEERALLAGRLMINRWLLASLVLTLAGAAGLYLYATTCDCGGGAEIPT
jgi:hypothetical protein